MILFFGGAAMEHFCAQDVVRRWYLGGALFKCRAAEKQKGWSGDIGCYKQATPTGFQAVGGLATEARAMEIWKKLLRSCG